MFNVEMAQANLEDPIGPVEEIAHRLPDYSLNLKHAADVAHLANAEALVLFACEVP